MNTSWWNEVRGIWIAEDYDLNFVNGAVDIEGSHLFIGFIIIIMFLRVSPRHAERYAGFRVTKSRIEEQSNSTCSFVYSE